MARASSDGASTRPAAASLIAERVPITKARMLLGHLARRVHVHKEYFILERGGFPVMGIMDAAELEAYLANRAAAEVAKSDRAPRQRNTRAKP
jgi:hypothetical protein